MDFDVSYSLENEQQFWDELDEIVGAHCETQSFVDNALKTYLMFTSSFTDEYLNTEYDWAKCAFKLLESSLFLKNKHHVRRRMIGRLRKETSNTKLRLITNVLLYDGRQHQKTFELMQEEGLFSRLMEMVAQKREEDRILWSSVLDLLYEMSRIQRLRREDLDSIGDGFISYLFQLVEEDPDDPNDPYHYPVIRMLLVLNEQYMVSAHAPPRDGAPEDSNAPTNKVIKILCFYGSTYKTFGENIILCLNRESETCLQLLILKLLYLLFTTSATYEYFYTNDLRVLVDVMIRNLLDLPEESESLRHTYLRVLYPLLEHTQLRHIHYKRDEILNLLECLSGVRSNHFQPVDQTTARLVSRCANVEWIKAPPGETIHPENPAHRLLGMSLGRQAQSSMSVLEVASQSEKPGVYTPSRNRGIGGDSSGVEIAGEA
ncbi:uncharacterized protein LAJ45_04213 [Morchella importuna]|uniref:SPIN90/Ldb17 leucine-rich domain-containing protein n=1 Tax=Morchella conica CCBAS932 TaxID=1392247 RepID=A0A3N4L3I8_9PEZI|nr:uncharacterized protein LAJ45_04213 [Morchella importuna]KAH8151591.1 hypothetical protein LAJ45_04213 [Morchella importuna]RPB15201.1 hypothetical protein P167DRAFT_502296 [Morchella conica CCBAS932]